MKNNHVKIQHNKMAVIGHHDPHAVVIQILHLIHYQSLTFKLHIPANVTLSSYLS